MSRIAQEAPAPSYAERPGLFGCLALAVPLGAALWLLMIWGAVTVAQGVYHARHAAEQVEAE
jgi:hypothetical protein